MTRSWEVNASRAARGGHAYGCEGPISAAVDEPIVDPGVAALPVADPQHHRLADQLAPMVEVWQRLLDQHRPDRSGRCRTCTQGGTGLPGTSWPCALHGIASLAQRRHGRA